MKKYVVIRRICCIIGVICFIYVLGIAGTSDLESELGYRLHENSWYHVRLGISMVVMCLCYLGTRIADWARGLSWKKLNWLEKKYGSEDKAVILYRNLLYFFKG